MSIRTILMAGVAGTLLAAAPLAVVPALAQAQSTPQATTPASNAVQVDKLVGKSVRNAQDEKIGDIESVYVTPGGEIDTVIVGVGGFLGMGERDVAVKWSELTVSPDGETITSSMTKESLKALPEYSYKDKANRGKVFSDAGVYKREGTTTNVPATMPRTDTTRADAARTDTTRTDAPNATTPLRGSAATKAFTPTGEMSADALIGATVKNTADETVGEIRDIHFGTDGSIKGAVVGVGGFLGMGERDVLMPWSDLKMVRDGDRDVVVRTEASKESLEAMPKYEM